MKKRLLAVVMAMTLAATNVPGTAFLSGALTAYAEATGATITIADGTSISVSKGDTGEALSSALTGFTAGTLVTAAVTGNGITVQLSADGYNWVDGDTGVTVISAGEVYIKVFAASNDTTATTGTITLTSAKGSAEDADTISGTIGVIVRQSLTADDFTDLEVAEQTYKSESLNAISSIISDLPDKLGSDYVTYTFVTGTGDDVVSTSLAEIATADVGTYSIYATVASQTDYYDREQKACAKYRSGKVGGKGYRFLADGHRWIFTV